MVEIIKNGNTIEERKLEDKVLNLHNITTELIGIGKATGYLQGDLISVFDNTISVHCSKNLIKVSEKEHFDTALKLAQAYEKETCEKWKLKEMY